MKGTKSKSILAAVLLAMVSTFVAPQSAQAQYPSVSEAPESMDTTGGKDVAVVFAVEDYVFLPDVGGVTQTANDWESFFVRGLGIPSSRVFVKTDSAGTREKMLAFASRAAKAAQPGGRVWFVFVGHGAPTNDGKDGLLVGVDAQSEPASLEARGVKRAELLEALEAGDQKETVVVIDACFSGKTNDGQALAKGMQPVVPTDIKSAPKDASTLVLSAAKANQFAGALPGVDRPAFSYLLLGALQGWADDGDGKVTAEEAVFWARRQMRHLDHEQEPEVVGAGNVVLTHGAGDRDPGVAHLLRGAGREVSSGRGVEADHSDAMAGERQRDSKLVPVAESPVRGPADAPVTVVQFADYQCTYSEKSQVTLEAIREQYGDSVRLVNKHYSLPFHEQARAASRAAIAAGEQGKFWTMHDLLFRYQELMKGKSDDEMKAWTAGFASRIGLDVDQFKRDFDAARTTDRIDQDRKLVEKLGVKGTPTFLVNGRKVMGSQPMPKFAKIIDQELEAAESARENGENMTLFYASRVEKNYERAESGKVTQKRPTKVKYVPVEGNDPMTGETDEPIVTVVVFSNYQCPFSAKAAPTIEKITRNYDEDVRVVLKQLPLPMHKQANMAAQIALAAHQQGKFWEMHELLFARQQQMRGKSDAEMVDWGRELAEEIGLNQSVIARALDQKTHAKEVDKESRLAKRLGARGTPHFWINGVQVVGSQPYSKFKEVIDAQLKIAKKLREDKNVDGKALYKAAVEYNKAN